jgi:toxin ParE1/3/4
MKPLLFTSAAERDLYDLLAYIAAQSPETAIQVVARIREKCSLLASHPQLGERRQEFGADHRCFPIERWVVIYRDRPGQVEIIRIVDGARDIDSLI